MKHSANGVMRLILGAGLLAMTTAPGAAAIALATGDVNMRASPVANAPVILLIPGGSNVDVLGCGYGWCEVIFGGRAGHAIQQRLDFGGDPPPPPRQIGGRPDYKRPPDPRMAYPPQYPEAIYPPQPAPGYRGRPYTPPPSAFERDEDALPPPGIDPPPYYPRGR